MKDTKMDRCIAGFIVGLIILVFISDGVWHRHLVKLGHGEYNSTTGEFQFLPPCNKETK